MPRHDQQVRLDAVLSYEERMVLTLVIDQLNLVRAQVGMPLLTPQDLHHEARAYVREYPRGGKR